DLTVVDLEELPQEKRDERVREHALDEAGRPFALGQGPLVRAALLLLLPDEHVLLMTMHHIVSDRRSTDVVAGELAALYAAFAAGRPSPRSAERRGRASSRPCLPRSRPSSSVTQVRTTWSSAPSSRTARDPRSRI